MISEVSRRIVRFCRRLTPVDIFGYKRSIILAGTGRSGTTWIEEAINSRNEYRIMFEPFHNKFVGMLSHWNYRQYLRPENRDKKFLNPASIILSGKIRNPWIDKFNRRHLPSRRLIKDIRAQLILKWIKTNFPEIPIVLLLRHPCAVANSKVQLGWDSHLDDFLAQDELMDDFLHPFKKELESACEPFTKHILMWCVENYVPLKQFVKGEILIVFYENVCRFPEPEIKKICEFIGGKFDLQTLENSRRPSALVRKESAVVCDTSLVESWRSSVSSSEIESTVEILRMFNLDRIYNSSSWPLVRGEDALGVFSSAGAI